MIGQTPGHAVFVAVDVHYLDDSIARAAVVAASDVRFSLISFAETVMIPVAAPYQPGAFHRRELPPLRRVLPPAGSLALIVIDGYVDLDAAGRPGLGRHVNSEFGVPVIGAAKTHFKTATHAAQVLRGRFTSSRPLYVTAAGMTVNDAARVVRQMAGRFR